MAGVRSGLRDWNTCAPGLPIETQGAAEKQLADALDKAQIEVAKQVRRCDATYPELPHEPYTGDDVVREPIFIYDVHAC